MTLSTSKVATKVSVYWNTHKGRFSVMSGQKVISHEEVIALYNVQPIIRPAGQAKSIETGTKTVHAFLRGWHLPDGDEVDVNTYLDTHPAMHVELAYNWKVDPFWKLVSPTFTAPHPLTDKDRFNRLDLMIDNNHRPRVYVS